MSVIIILANGSSYLGRSFQGGLLPYGNSLGLNATWNFFSPDPAHTMFYKVKIYFQDDQGNDLKEPEEIFYPPEKDQIVVNSSRRRFLYSMRFLTIETSRIKTLMGPWICRNHPGATKVRMEHVIEQIPYLDVAVARRSEPLSELLTERNFINVETDCLHLPEDPEL